MWFYVQMWFPLVDSRFDCRDLLQRSVIHHGTATNQLQTICSKRRTSVFGALGPFERASRIEALGNEFMVKAVELDIKLQKIANGNYTASSPTRV